MTNVDVSVRQHHALLTGNLPALRAFARTLHRSSDEADDLVQETLLKGLANIDQFKPGTKMKSWLFTIMRNTFYTNIRKARREGPGLLDGVELGLSMEATQEWSVRKSEVGRAIQRLPATQREVLVLVTVLGTSYEEAAQICACNLGTIKSRLNRARNSLLADLGEGSSTTAVFSEKHLSQHETSAQSAL